MNSAVAQDMEPRRWTHLPIDTNVLGVGYVHTSGDLEFDPVLQVEDAKFDMDSIVVSYNRTFALLDTTARLDVELPFRRGDWDGRVSGEMRSVSRNGLDDPRLRLSVNLVGSPPLRGVEYMEYRKDHATTTIVGAAVSVRLPWGDYLDDKVINLGENRYVFQPQLGVLHTRGPWSFELTGSMFLYTDNDEYFNGNTLEQDPLYAVQAHVVRTLGDGYWVAAGAAYGWAGETDVNGVSNDDPRSNLLYGFSFGFPVTDTQSMRVGYISRSALEDTGADSDTFFAGWSIRF